MMKKLTLHCIAAVLLVLVAYPAHAHETEAYYQRRMCQDIGVTEYRLDDGTRVDCLTRTHAWEVDFQHKWAESIGQALHYASKTGRIPGVVLVGDRAWFYAERVRAISDKYGLGIEIMMIDTSNSQQTTATDHFRDARGKVYFTPNLMPK